MLREKLKDILYYNERVNYKTKRLEKLTKKIKSDAKFTDVVKMRNSHTLVDDTIRLQHQKYSRGDDLAEFKVHLEAVLEYRGWQKKYADLLPKNEQKNRIGWEEIREDYLENWLEWLSFAYCLDMGSRYYQQVFQLMGNQGLDALFDNVAVKMGVSSREVSNTLLFKKRFKKLYAVIEAEPEQRPKLMSIYLDAWYELYGSPDLHLMDTNTYVGYWCWEAALIVKLYGIDDSSFIDHEYYPKDLVHWQKGK